jgi:uncharacterized tellurite resistance protein B-like protein
MYTTVTTQDQAVAHLFFHCCLKDGQFNKDEIKTVSDLIVTAGLNQELNLKDEIVHYRSYYQGIADEQEYLQYLIGLIQPANELALFSYCVDLCLSDKELATSEETLLSRIAEALNIDEEERRTVQKLIVQLDVVEAQKFF